MAKKREEIIAALRKKGLDLRIPERVTSAFVELVRTYLRGSTMGNLNRYKQSLRDAIEQQEAIGINMMIRGFFATGWVMAIKDHECSHPDRTMNALQRMVWDSIVDPLWKVRNDILHRMKNNFDAAEEERMAEKLVWYSMHKYDLLDSYDHFLASYDVSQIHTMTRVVKREWLRHLDAAREAYEKHRAQRALGQNSITQYLQRLNARPAPLSRGAAPG